MNICICNHENNVPYLPFVATHVLGNMMYNDVHDQTHETLVKILGFTLKLLTLLFRV